MEMQQVIYFRALCEELNFTRAARRCNVSQPSLTRSIRLLEEEFGGALFHRERNQQGFRHALEIAGVNLLHRLILLHYCRLAANWGAERA